MNLRSFSCPSFSLTFHLWGNGGPDWRRELRLFELEEATSWSPAVASRRGQQNLPPNQLPQPRKSFADAVRLGPVQKLTGANAIPLGRRSAFLRLQQPRSPLLPSAGRLGARNNGGRSSNGGSTGSRNSGPRDKAAGLFCPRCLSSGHRRVDCRRPLKCYACMQWGHAEFYCRSRPAVKTGKHAGNSNRPAPRAGWVNRAETGPYRTPDLNLTIFSEPVSPEQQLWAAGETALSQPITVLPEGGGGLPSLILGLALDPSPSTLHSPLPQ